MDIVIPFNDPLNEGDTEVTTFGCRQNNPSICGSNMLEGICAFTREDCICQKPSRLWKKQYKKLNSNN